MRISKRMALLAIAVMVLLTTWSELTEQEAYASEQVDPLSDVQEPRITREEAVNHLQSLFPGVHNLQPETAELQQWDYIVPKAPVTKAQAGAVMLRILQFWNVAEVSFIQPS